MYDKISKPIAFLIYQIIRSTMALYESKYSRAAEEKKREKKKDLKKMKRLEILKMKEF